MKRAVVFALALAGCADNERLAPTAIADAGVPEGPPAVDAGPLKRQVLLRNPFAARVDNLFVDGDYELSAQGYPGSQLGWRAFSGGGAAEVVTPTETGGLCKSGLRCAVLNPGIIYIVRGASAPNQAPMRASMSAKPPTGKCGLVAAVPVVCDTFIALPYPLNAKSVTAGDDGWCDYEAHVPGRDSSLCLYVSSTLPVLSTALVDDAVLEVDPDPPPPMGVPTAKTVISADEEAALARIRRIVRDGMPLGPQRAPRYPRGR